MIKVVPETVEKAPEQIEIQLVCDLNGLLDLKSVIETLIARDNDHVHLFDESWGGHHIQAVPSETGLLVPHIKITRVQDDISN